MSGDSGWSECVCWDAPTNSIESVVFVQRMVSGLPDWMRLWCVMRQNRLRCWKNPENVGRSMPEQVIELSEVRISSSAHTQHSMHIQIHLLGCSSLHMQDMVVQSAPRLLMRRPNAIFLKDRHSELHMAFESKEEREQWMEKLQQAVVDLRVWRSSCDFLIPQPNSKFYADSPSAHFREVPKMKAESQRRGQSSLTKL